MGGVDRGRLLFQFHWIDMLTMDQGRCFVKLSCTPASKWIAGGCAVDFLDIFAPGVAMASLLSLNIAYVGCFFATGVWGCCQKFDREGGDALLRSVCALALCILHAVDSSAKVVWPRQSHAVIWKWCRGNPLPPAACC